MLRLHRQHVAFNILLSVCCRDVEHVRSNLLNDRSMFVQHVARNFQHVESMLNFMGSCFQLVTGRVYICSLLPRTSSILPTCWKSRDTFYPGNMLKEVFNKLSACWIQRLDSNTLIIFMQSKRRTQPRNHNCRAVKCPITASVNRAWSLTPQHAYPEPHN